MQQLKLKLLELGKTKINNASLDMFNIYVFLAGRDTAGLPRAGGKSQPHHYKKSIKTEGPSESMSFKGKTIGRLQTKKEQKHYSRLFKRIPVNARPSYKKRSKPNKTLKKAFRSNLLELCKTNTKKSNPDMVICYVVFAGLDMVTDVGRATKCTCKFKAPSL